MFCADHGVAKEGVSVFEQRLSSRLTKAGATGKAIANIFAGAIGSECQFVDVGLAHDVAASARLVVRKIANATGNIANESAMTRADCLKAIGVGEETAAREIEKGADILAVGEIGIANTTAAAALAAALIGTNARAVVGKGTGVTGQRLTRKMMIVDRALALLRPDKDDAIDCLAKVGGFEIAAMAGAMLRGAALQRPVVVDGFASSVAGLAATTLEQNVRPYLVFSHRSTEVGQGVVLTRMEARPLLDWGLGIGEGTGAILGMLFVDLACQVLRSVSSVEGGIESMSGV